MHDDRDMIPLPRGATRKILSQDNLTAAFAAFVLFLLFLLFWIETA